MIKNHISSPKMYQHDLGYVEHGLFWVESDVTPNQKYGSRFTAFSNIPTLPDFTLILKNSFTGIGIIIRFSE